MAENFKHLYHQMKRMVEMYQDEIVPELRRLLDERVEVGSCEGCLYSNRKRPQKCSCCRRNRDLKDCYERREENA